MDTALLTSRRRTLVGLALLVGLVLLGWWRYRAAPREGTIPSVSTAMGETRIPVEPGPVDTTTHHAVPLPIAVPDGSPSTGAVEAGGVRQVFYSGEGQGWATEVDPGSGNDLQQAPPPELAVDAGPPPPPQPGLSAQERLERMERAVTLLDARAERLAREVAEAERRGDPQAAMQRVLWERSRVRSQEIRAELPALRAEVARERDGGANTATAEAGRP